MNQNSLSAYFDGSNQRKFNSHRAKIVRELSRNPNRHSTQLASKLKLSNEATKKRIVELKFDNIIEVSGNIEYYGNMRAVYKIKDQLSIFPEPTRLSFRKWVKKNYPDIIYEYEILIEHSL